MGKSSPSPPPAPDPVATAQAQGQANREAAEATQRLNMINQQSPFGTLTYRPTGEMLPVAGGDPIAQYESITTLSPEQQRQLDLTNRINEQYLTMGQGALGRVGESIATPFDMSGLPSAPGADEAARQRAEEAIYGRATSRLDPFWERQQKDLENGLVNMGFTRGSEAWREAMADFSRQRTDAYGQAEREAQIGGTAELESLFGLGSAARQNALAEMILERNQPLQEAQALVGASSGITVPQFAGLPGSQVSPADVTGATAISSQAQQNAYNTKSQAQSSQTGSLYGLAGTAAMAAAYFF